MIIIEDCIAKPVEKQGVEIVERKGLGHPDYIADSLAECFSSALVREYLDNHGTVLHYNVDKLETVGGASKTRYGGGKIETPPMVFFSGRASKTNKNLEELAISSAKSWFRKNLRFLDPESIRYVVETKQGAANLTVLGRGIRANDTSIGIGYAPLSKMERLVLGIERFANSGKFKKMFPYSGEDVKVMGIRRGGEKKFIMSMAFVDRFTKNEADYFRKKQDVVEAIMQKTGQKVMLNCADKKGIGERGCFLTVTGTSLEMGDDGAVGRGNRINGLISFNRYFSMEAVAGKNIVNHVGKVYNILAQASAEKIVQKEPGIGEVYVKMLSRIGSPLEKPETVVVSTENPVKRDFIEDVIAKILDKNKIKSIIKNRKSIF